jgi:hypothetical protein
MTRTYTSWLPRTGLLAALLMLAGTTGVWAQCVEQVGRWALGPPSVLAASGSSVVLGSGSALLVAEPDAGGALVVVGELELPMPPVGIVSAGDLVLVAGWHGLHVVDVSQPDQPVEVGALAVGWRVLDLAVQGTTALLLGDEGLAVVDVSKPEAPVMVTPPSAATDWGVAVAADEQLVYVAGPNRLTVADVSVPEEPVEVGSLRLGRDDDIVVHGQHVFLADRSRGTTVVDVTDPTAPRIAGQLSAARALALDGTRLLAVTGSRLHVYDVSDPAAPILTATGTTSQGIAVTALDDHAFVADSGLPGIRSYLLEPGQRPSEVARLGLPGPAQAVALSASGRYAFVAANDLVVLDLADPEAPVQVATWQAAYDLFDLALAGDTLVASDWGDHVRVLDVSEPTGELHDTGGLPTFGIEPVVVADGTTAFASDGGPLRMIDIADAAHPAVLGQLELGSGLGVQLAVSDDLVYVQDETGLRIIDAVDPTGPAELGSAPLPGVPAGIDVAGTLAYLSFYDLSGDEKGLAIFDVAVPTAPYELGRCATPESPGRLAVVDGVALVAGVGATVMLIDVGDPLRPRLRTTLPATGSPVYGRDIDVVPPIGVVAMGELGVSILEVRPCPPRHPTRRVEGSSLELGLPAP